MKQPPFVFFLLAVAILCITDREPETVAATARKKNAYPFAGLEPTFYAGQDRPRLFPGEETDESLLRSLRDIDSAKAIRLAQRYESRELWEMATHWYLVALEWNPTSQIAAEGFALSSFGAGKQKEAYQTACKMENSSPALKQAVIRCATREVEQLRRENRDAEVRELLAQIPEAETSAPSLRPRPRQDPPWVLASARPEPLPRAARLMQGWTLYHRGCYAEAANIFEALSFETNDRESARGLIYSLRSLGDTDRLQRLVEKHGGILLQESGPCGH